MKAWVPILLSACVLAACGGGGGGNSGSSNTVHNVLQVIPEGDNYVVALPAGNYHARITSNPNGVTINWVGGTSCSNYTSEVKTYTGDCKMSAPGQLVIGNPTMLGLGADESVTVVITKD